MLNEHHSVLFVEGTFILILRKFSAHPGPGPGSLPGRSGKGAGVGIGMLRGAGDSPKTMFDLLRFSYVFKIPGFRRLIKIPPSDLPVFIQNDRD